MQFVLNINQPEWKFGNLYLPICPCIYVNSYWRVIKRNLNIYLKKIGVTTFETDRIPEHWVEPCNQMDEICVPSQFNIETFSKSGLIKIN